MLKEVDYEIENHYLNINEYKAEMTVTYEYAGKNIFKIFHAQRKIKENNPISQKVSNNQTY